VKKTLKKSRGGPGLVSAENPVAQKSPARGREKVETGVIIVIERKGPRTLSPQSINGSVSARQVRPIQTRTHGEGERPQPEGIVGLQSFVG